MLLKKNIIIALIILTTFNKDQPTCIVTNIGVAKLGILQLGDAINAYVLAKLLALRYNLPFVYSHFVYHDLFMFSGTEKSDLDIPIWSGKNEVFIKTDQDLVSNLGHNAVLFTSPLTSVEFVAPKCIAHIKKDLQFKTKPKVFDLPSDMVSIAVHIRKGNGGGEIYDGELSSVQEFDFDRSEVIYNTELENYPFDFGSIHRKNGHIIENSLLEALWNNKLDTDPVTLNGKLLLDQCWENQTHFPPNQFYIDQINKVISDLSPRKIFIQLFTDDKDPEALLSRIKNHINHSNAILHYENNRALSFRERIHQDLFMMSRCEILIRGRSGFARIAELIGNHKIIMFPVKYRWDKNKLIMIEIVVREPSHPPNIF